MLGTALQLGGVRGEDRFYIPVKARKNQNQRKQADTAESADSSPKSKVLDSENNSDESLSSLSKPSSCPSVETVSNIDSFLESTTPLVTVQYFSKTTMRGWKTCDVEYQSYFSLDDLWDSFKEWSAYGAGVPLLLDQQDSVVQYYVPSLSAIQLYGRSAQKSNAKPRHTSEDVEGDNYRDSSSDGSSDSEYGKRTEHLIGDVSFGMSRLSVHDKHSTMQEGFSSDDSETGNPKDLLFEYFEPDNPYSREPLADKVLYLAQLYPGLKSLRSCDLSPPSWMSVAWYPIYRIPTGPTLKDLDARFLTYHTLHMPSAGSGHSPAPKEVDGVPKISLPAFAMASYKLKGPIWSKKGVSDHNSLFQAADNWLSQLQVNHPDYQFFKSWRHTTGELN